MQIAAAVANLLVKCAIVAFYLRLFGTVRWVRVFSYGWLIAIPCIFGAYLIALLVFCIPSPGQPWDSSLTQRCNKTSPATLAFGICNVIIDVAIFVMPFFIIYRLHIDQQRKAALAGVFLIGFL